MRKFPPELHINRECQTLVQRTRSIDAPALLYFSPALLFNDPLELAARARAMTEMKRGGESQFHKSPTNQPQPSTKPASKS